jgi:tRNA (uracil-5-)-methyltransferase
MPLPSFDPANYSSQLSEKLENFKLAFAEFDLPEPMVFASTPLHYRMRAEFRMWHQGERVDYAMFDSDNPKQPVMIEVFPAATESISTLMPATARQAAGMRNIEASGCFQINFLATLSGELLVTLIYHRPLDECLGDSSTRVIE